MVSTRKTWIHVLPYWAHRIVSLPVSLLRRLDVVSLLLNQQVCLVRSPWFVITQIKLEKIIFSHNCIFSFSPLLFSVD